MTTAGDSARIARLSAARAERRIFVVLGTDWVVAGVALDHLLCHGSRVLDRRGRSLAPLAERACRCVLPGPPTQHYALDSGRILREVRECDRLFEYVLVWLGLAV